MRKVKTDKTLLIRGIPLFLVWLFSTGLGMAQSCANPAQLCPEVIPEVEDFDISIPLSYGCMDVANTFYFQFTTNSNADNTGNAIINIENINCPGQSASDTLYAMVVEQPQIGMGDPCNPANWNIVAGCEQDTMAIELITPDLNASTNYFVIIGSNQPSNQMTCTFETTISGPAVDINACCDDQISLGESAQITAIGGDIPPGYLWDPPSWLDDTSTQSPTTYPEETITYVATGEINGCTVTDEVTVFVGPPISIYNTFTPNDDGINDTWEIGGIDDFSNAQINVYDRWGQVVFKSLGYATPWDGTNRGKFLPSATYYYVIELNSLDVAIPPVTGNVTIIH